MNKFANFAVATALLFGHANPGSATQLMTEVKADSAEIRNTLLEGNPRQVSYYDSSSKDLMVAKRVLMTIDLITSTGRAAQEFFGAFLDNEALAKENDDASISVKKSGKIWRSQFSLIVPYALVKSVLSTDLPEGVAAEVLLSRDPSPQNLSRQLSRNVFDQIREVAYDSFVGMAKINKRQEVSSEANYAAIGQHLDSIRSVLEKAFNMGNSWSEDQWGATKYLLANGLVAYGFQWGGISPHDEDEAREMVYVIMKMTLKPQQLRYAGFLRFKNYRKEKCRDDEIDVILVDDSKVSAPDKFFCAKTRSVKNSIFDGARYSTGPFHFLKDQRILDGFALLSGKGIAYVKSKDSPDWNPEYVLVEGSAHPKFTAVKETETETE